MTPPEYKALEHALAQVGEDARASQVIVFDDVGLIWCSASLIYHKERPVIFSLVKAALEPLQPPLHRGGHLNRTVHGGNLSMYCRNFAATYVVGVIAEGQLDELLAHRVVASKLKCIEDLTVRLPPPDGHDPTSGEAAGSRA